jgi:alpha-ribazole phosphatase
MDVVLIRHARPRIADGICYGRLDAELAQPVSPGPARMLAAAGTQVPDRIVASTAARARDTARLLAQALSVKAPAPAVETDGRLCELDFGAWEGLSWDAVPRDQLDLWAADLLGACPHGGESAAQGMARVTGWADALPADAPGCIWMVGHAGPMRMLAAHWLGVPLAVTTSWRLGWGATCGFRLGGHAPAMLWWNRDG